MKLKEGSILQILFRESFSEGKDNYLKFINHCFANCLISGVDVAIESIVPTTKTVLTIKIAAPGIDRIKDAITKHNGATIV